MCEELLLDCFGLGPKASGSPVISRQHPRGQFSFAYSAFAAIRIGISGSASSPVQWAPTSGMSDIGANKVQILGFWISPWPKQNWLQDEVAASY